MRAPKYADIEAVAMALRLRTILPDSSPVVLRRMYLADRRHGQRRALRCILQLIWILKEVLQRCALWRRRSVASGRGRRA